jgi:hypothetical protein
MYSSYDYKPFWKLPLRACDRVQICHLTYVTFGILPNYSTEKRPGADGVVTYFNIYAENIPSYQNVSVHLSLLPVAYPGIYYFSGWGVYARIYFRVLQQIQLSTESRENENLRAVAPSQGFHSICK